MQGTLLFESRRVVSVGQLTRSVKTQLEREFDGLWVRGEVSNLRIPSSGHAYFNLKDETASLRTVLFKGTAARLKFRIKDGTEILVRGRITVYEPKGEYQLVADAIEPVGAGALQLAFEELKKKLLDEGLFAEARKKPLPAMPRRIGVVTSRTGAALRDVLVVLRRRSPGVEVLVAPVRVQGDGAAAGIADAIRRMDRDGDVEVLIVTRGGGSIEDLWAFNEEPVARAIAACDTPTVSAVGHEIDFTIADFVADKRAATPSNAAEMVVPDEVELRTRVGELHRRAGLAKSRRLERHLQQVKELRRRLKDPTRLIADRRLAIDDFAERMGNVLKREILARRSGVLQIRRTLFSAGPLGRVARERHRVETAHTSLAVAHERQIASRQARLGELAGRLDAISPLAVLRRGYALVRDEESAAVVRRASETHDGQRLTVKLAEGEIRVRVRGAPGGTGTGTGTGSGTISGRNKPG